MWFFDETNPNGALTDTLAAANPTLFDGAHKDATNDGEYDDDMCHLEYFHKSKPTPEPDLTVCSPWKKGACCKAKTVRDTETIMQAYGPEYHWDLCGRLSPQCEMYFIYEACFYECDPAGLWRKHPKHVFDTETGESLGWRKSGDHWHQNSPQRVAD
jgi:folate receptor